jgi:hypothetical protein
MHVKKLQNFNELSLQEEHILYLPFFSTNEPLGRNKMGRTDRQMDEPTFGCYVYGFCGVHWNSRIP